jgi:hypothetical protein
MAQRQKVHGRKVDDAMYAEIARLRREEGLKPPTIAKRLGLAKATVQMHVARVDAEAATNGQGEASTSVVPKLDDVPFRWVRLAGETQAWAQLNRQVVDEYADLMRAGIEFPPVVLFFNGDESFWIGDGFHRCHAARQIGRETIRAEVRRGDERDALLYSCGANITHGWRRTNADKRRAVELLLRDDEWRRWSNHQIAHHCGVTPPFVGKLRRSLETVSSDDGQRTYRREGREQTMDTSRIGTRAEPHAPTNGPPADDNGEEGTVVRNAPGVVHKLEMGAATTVPAALQHTSACSLGGPAPTPCRRDPAPPVEVPITRRWYWLVSRFTQVLLDFGHAGGVEPLLAAWTPEERTRAKAELGKVRDQLDRLDDALSAPDSPSGQAEDAPDAC